MLRTIGRIGIFRTVILLLGFVVGGVVQAAPQSVSGGALAAVGPGDTIAITVYGQPELSGRATVDADGQIAVPIAGTMVVQGLSPTEIGRRVAQGLRERGYLVDPQVSIEVVSVRSQVASVLGEVLQPGRYPLEGPVTVLELLSMAGGLKPDAADTAVLMRRTETGEAVPISITLSSGPIRTPSEIAWGMRLQNGDVLHVGEMPRFYVYGEVSRAGSYAMEPELNVMRAIALAGGFTQRASERRIEIRRADPQTGELKKQRVEHTDSVQPGDVIYVNERFF